MSKAKISYTSDVAVYGLSMIADGGYDPDSDIVFVHGLQGHPKKHLDSFERTQSDSNQSVLAQKPGRYELKELQRRQRRVLSLAHIRSFGVFLAAGIPNQ
jgi:predicted Zn-dependent protease